jgi:hypothetical protein
MSMQDVSSSNIRAVGYDADTSTLTVEFHGGRVYRYRGVPASVYRGLMSAASHGSYFHDHIKDRYPTIRVR